MRSVTCANLASFNDKMPGGMCYQELKFLPATEAQREEVELKLFYCNRTVKIKALNALTQNLFFCTIDWRIGTRRPKPNILSHIYTCIIPSIDLSYLTLKIPAQPSLVGVKVQHRDERFRDWWCLTQLITTHGDRAKAAESWPPAIFQEKVPYMEHSPYAGNLTLSHICTIRSLNSSLDVFFVIS